MFADGRQTLSENHWLGRQLLEVASAVGRRVVLVCLPCPECGAPVEGIWPPEAGYVCEACGSDRVPGCRLG